MTANLYYAAKALLIRHPRSKELAGLRREVRNIEADRSSKRLVAIIEAAKAWHEKEGLLEIDTNSAIVSEGKDAGAYVSAWVWVDLEDECDMCGLRCVSGPTCEECDACTECGEPSDGGDGYDGLCGNCADRKYAEEYDEDGLKQK